MVNVKSDERRLEILEQRHIAADNRWLDKRDKAIAAIEREGLMGELCREGKTVYYVNIRNRQGQLTGKTKEGNYSEIVDYLIRNKYV